MTIDELEYEKWENALDFALTERFMLGLSDMVDAPTRAHYDSGLSVAEAAWEVAQNDEMFAPYLEEYAWELEAFEASAERYLAEND